MSPWQAQSASSSEGLDGLARRPRPRGTAVRWQDIPPSSARDKLSITCSCTRAPHVSFSPSSADAVGGFEVPRWRCLGASEGKWGTEMLWMLWSACWCKSASKSCVSHGEQVPSRTWSPCVHAPSHFHSLIEVESTTWRGATNKELPSPRLQCVQAWRGAQWSRPALDLLQNPSRGRESHPDTVQEVEAEAMPRAEARPRGSQGYLAILVAGGRGMQSNVWARAGSAVLRGLLHPLRKEREAPVKVRQNTNQSVTLKLLHSQSSHEKQMLHQALRPVSQFSEGRGGIPL